MNIHVYGIPSCTTVRKSVKWLEGQGVAHTFTPFAQVDDLASHLRDWIGIAGQDKIMNARAATFRALPEDVQARMLADPDFAIAQMVADPRLIKRPVLVAGGKIASGFKDAEWGVLL